MTSKDGKPYNQESPKPCGPKTPILPGGNGGATGRPNK